MQQLFRFACSSRQVLVGANNEVEARGKLQVYLKKHPLLANFTCWRLKEICGKVDDNIYMLANEKMLASWP